MAKETLFEEMEIGSLRAKNRLVRAATYEALADDGGHMTPELTAIYEELADGGIVRSSWGMHALCETNSRILGCWASTTTRSFPNSGH